jgi:D-threo-aldose 1-dehydrogenase
VLYLHDPERISFEEGVAAGGVVEAMIALRDEGVVDHLGVAGGDLGVLTRYLRTGDFEIVLNHNRFTLVDQSAVSLMEETIKRGAAFVNAAPYGGGMLAKGPDDQPRYAYGARGGELRERVLEMQSACEEFGVPLAAAALQFSVRDCRVTSTVVGVSSPERVSQTLDLLSVDISDDLWAKLSALAPPAGSLLA